MIIEINKLHYKKFLKNISLILDSTNINCIIGSTGSGKSLLLDLINNSIKSSKSISYLKQVNNRNNENKNIYNNLKKILINNKILDIECDKYIKNAFKKFNMSKDILDKSYNELHFIDYRKVKLVEVFLSNSKLVLLDEPTLGFNQYEKNNFIKMVKQIKRKYSKLFVIATSDMELVSLLGDYIIILENGNIDYQGYKKDIFSDYNYLSNKEINIPQIIRFNKLFFEKKHEKLLPRNDTSDLLKDICRYKWE